jgi:hypothetical protein
MLLADVGWVTDGDVEPGRGVARGRGGRRSAPRRAASLELGDRAPARHGRRPRGSAQLSTPERSLETRRLARDRGRSVARVSPKRRAEPLFLLTPQSLWPGRFTPLPRLDVRGLQTARAPAIPSLRRRLSRSSCPRAIRRRRLPPSVAAPLGRSAARGCSGRLMARACCGGVDRPEGDREGCELARSPQCSGQIGGCLRAVWNR